MMQLSIKRVPTVVSNHQKDEAEETARQSGGCGKNCLRSCCIPGAKLPLYAFKKENNIGNEKDVLEIENKESPIAFLDFLVLGEWEDRMQRGLFRYDVTACETKVISGEHGFIAQLNEGRHLKKRPTEFRVDKVLQPFDGNKFNFTKVGQEEVLFQFEASEDGEVQFFPKAPIDVENSPSVVAINVSPIEYGHVLLIPRILECLPQRIDHKSLLLALYMAAEAGNPHFRLGYNSLGAFATINHLHFQAYYLAVPFPIEKAPTKKITTLNDGVIISELLKYPVRGLVFGGGNTLQDLSDTVSDACICLQDNNIPYNVLISDCGKRIFILPQCYAEKQALGEVNSELLDTQVNPAVWEISGHMVLKRRKDYDESSEENAWRLLAEVSLSDERFREVNELIFEAIAGGTDVIESVAVVEDPDTKTQSFEEENTITDSSHHAMVVGTQECLVLQ
ncbi:GDP-L-galactose phosphorylase 1 [Hibiscus syriacus]|uniref:GDP-L-galactose phosphorylase 1 n=1 Tax=Hibiscus syriacus TaxID=106335 RepID=A0A6A3API4_HIBSY|nr:GDP-L-galactose phosphorylase 2-like [Hibiscus syriacus]KAE8706551.1 GDP-L-galactose phosphorylase 1 [Hibiscus syriacus]